MGGLKSRSNVKRRSLQLKTAAQIGNPGWRHLPIPFSIFSRAARMFSAISEHRSRRVVGRNALRLAGLAVLAVLLPAGMPLAAQTVQFTGALTIVGKRIQHPRWRSGGCERKRLRRR